MRITSFLLHPLPQSVFRARVRAGGRVQCVFSLAMAKEGEGDPRWIVSERADGKNVDGWHWYAGG